MTGLLLTSCLWRVEASLIGLCSKGFQKERAELGLENWVDSGGEGKGGKAIRQTFKSKKTSLKTNVLHQVKW